MKTIEIDNSIRKIIAVLQKARCLETTGLNDGEVMEETLWLLLRSREEIGELVKEIDPDRFAPIRSTSLKHQELNHRRLHVCEICGSSRCSSDHK